MAETPRPADFLGDNPPPRIIGTESECSIQLPPYQKMDEYVTPKAINNAGFSSVPRTDYTSGRMLDNGSSLYIDVGHLEINSAEALGPAEAAAVDLASIEILKRIVLGSGIPHRGLHRTSGTIFRGTQRTNGYHENYLFPRYLANSALMDTVMASHLTSRVYGMSGIVNEGIQLSQKVKGIGDPPITRAVERRTAHGNKPMAMIPPSGADSDTMGDDQWARLEVRFADARLSPTANFLTLAATSLALRIIEHSHATNIKQLVAKSFKANAATAHKFNDDLTFTTVAETTDGSHISAVDYQEMLVIAANVLAERIALPDDEMAAIELWSDVCDGLRAADFTQGEYAKLTAVLDLAMRHRYLTSRFKPADLNSRNEKAWEANLTWDRILPVGGGLTAWAKIPSPYVSQADIEKFVTNPPATRARIRSNAIRKGGHRIKSASWSRLVMNSGRKRDLTDPYAVQL